MEQFDLGAFIPKRSFYTKYVQRDMGDGLSDIELLELAVKNGFNSLWKGPTGPGKTALFLATAAKNEWPLGTANLNGQTTVEDLVGQIIPVPQDQHKLAQLRELVVRAKVELESVLMDEARTKDQILRAKEQLWRCQAALESADSHGMMLEWVDGLLIRLMKGDPRFEHTIFLADEVNFAPAKVMAILNGVTDDRRQIAIVQHQGEIVEASPGFHFGAAMNPFYEGTRALNKAFKDRFIIQVDFDYDEKVEAKLVNDERLTSMIAKFRKMTAEGVFHTPTSTRMILQYQALEKAISPRVARECFVSHYDEDEQEAVRNTAELYLGRGSNRNTAPMGSLTPNAV
jgi:MoxR-like ATPase